MHSAGYGVSTHIMVVVGEASADRYAARLVEKLKKGPGGAYLSFFGTGGDRMQAAGVDISCHIRELASIGPREAVSHLGLYLKTYRGLIEKAARSRPQVAVLLDFPEFNLRLSPRLKLLGVPVVYYISPQLWAWRRARVRIVRDTVDRMLVILPFEEGFYRNHGVDAQFVGHPLLEEFHPCFDRQNFLRRHGLAADRTTIAVLPGSRWREVEYILPTLLEAGLALGGLMPAQFAISAAPSVDGGRVRQIVQQTISGRAGEEWFRVIDEDSRDILANADFGWVKSGTSTLEAALVGIPFLMVYRVSWASGVVGKLLIRSRFKGLVNLIAQKEVVPELIQSDATPEKIVGMTHNLLRTPGRCAAMLRELDGIRERLGRQVASETVAEVVRGYLGNLNP
jgi:lipid-A-disaccharide synthase